MAVFLRKLEYYDGVFFLTTNLVQHFDDAILNRVHLMMRYDKLEKEARKTIFNRFLETTNGGRGLSDIGAEYVDRFACVLLNGRQVIKSCVLASKTLAYERFLDQTHHCHCYCIGSWERRDSIHCAHLASSGSERPFHSGIQ